jgi:uncharacterized protein
MRQEQEIRDNKVIKAILSGSHICRIAMLDGVRPYIVPVDYGYADNCIYIHSAPHGKKIELLKKSPLVCFEIEWGVKTVQNVLPCKWATRYRSVIGYANAEIVNDLAQKKSALDIIMSQHGAQSTGDYNEKQIDALVIIKLHIDFLTAKQSGNWGQEVE